MISGFTVGYVLDYFLAGCSNLLGHIDMRLVLIVSSDSLYESK